MAIQSYSPQGYQTQSDFELISELLEKCPRYSIPMRLRAKVVACIEKVIDKEDNDDITKLAAIRTLSKLDDHNIKLLSLATPKKVEHTDIKKCTDEELLTMAQEVVKLLPKPIDANFTVSSPVSEKPQMVS